MESTSLVKAFSLIELLGELGGSGSLNQLAVGTRTTKPTAHRILRCMVGLGYVQHDAGGIYCLTAKLRWVVLGRSDRRLASIADPLLRRLHVQTGETVNLGVLRRNRVAYITVLESSHALRRVVEAHESDPIFSTALGRAIAAHLPEAEINHLFANGAVEALTPQTTRNQEELRRILAKVRGLGYAIERDETDLGVTCIAAVVVSQAQPIAAISLSVPSARVDPNSEKRWIAQVQATAQSLSGELSASERVTA